ncbi:AraC family transcriptional regulator [Polaribacter sp.]|uniref:AraC family transcriptional regulator n=1 Tax=Polaribacter sp. TaxID=1920175 RepID=UPI003F6C0CF8
MEIIKANRMVTPLNNNNFFSILNYTKAKFTFPIHFHPEYELKLVMNASGKRIIGDSNLSFEINDLVLVGPNTPHVWAAKPIGKYAHVITIHFNAESFLSNSFLDKDSSFNLKELLKNSKRGVLFSKEAIEKISNSIILLSTLSYDFNSILKLLSILHQLSISENQKLLASSNYKGPVRNTYNLRVKKVITFIENNFQDQIRIKDISKIISMSESAFSHFFKKTTNKSFTDFLTEYRIGNASKLLLESEKNISEICYSSGFNNLSNFNRIFKRMRGCSPKEFRKKHNLTRLF